MEAGPLPQVVERWCHLNHDIAWSRLERAMDSVAPNCGLADARPLAGGISATTLLLVGDCGARFVARKPGPWRTQDNPDAAATEHRILDLLFKAGLNVPRALFLEEDDTVPLAERFFVMEFVEGEPRLSHGCLDDYLERYAAELVRIHSVPFETVGLADIRRLKHPWRPRASQSDVRLAEERIRAALESMGPRVSGNAPVLRHADFWPGNVLWRDGEIVAVVDWENVCIGEPLDDLAICRLDLLWVFGMEAMERFTELYLAFRPVDTFLLPYHDLVASLRPANYVEHFAVAYAPLGRPDITEETLVSDHRRFVDQALHKLETGHTSS